VTWRVRVRPEAELDRVFARRFPYAVYYQVLDNDVVVLSIMHARRQRQR